MISIMVFYSFDMDNIATDLAQAYSDPDLYNNALDKVKIDQSVKELLGEIEPVGNMAILEGHVEFSNDDNTVFSSLRIVGSKGNATMDISADRKKNTWEYNKINIRIKNPPENKQEIEIYPGNEINKSQLITSTTNTVSISPSRFYSKMYIFWFLTFFSKPFWCESSIRTFSNVNRNDYN